MDMVKRADLCVLMDVQYKDVNGNTLNPLCLSKEDQKLCVDFSQEVSGRVFKRTASLWKSGYTMKIVADVFSDDDGRFWVQVAFYDGNGVGVPFIKLTRDQQAALKHCADDVQNVVAAHVSTLDFLEKQPISMSNLVKGLRQREVQ